MRHPQKRLVTIEVPLKDFVLRKNQELSVRRKCPPPESAWCKLNQVAEVFEQLSLPSSYPPAKSIVVLDSNIISPMTPNDEHRLGSRNTASESQSSEFFCGLYTFGTSS